MANNPIWWSQPIEPYRFRYRRSFVVRFFYWILDLIGFAVGPSITSFTPASGCPGAMIRINGHRFSPVREQNQVKIGGRYALVVSASATELMAITAPDVATGPVTVTVDGLTGTGPVDFAVRGYPSAGAGEDGPPISFLGQGGGAQDDVNAIGTIRVLVSLVRPSDRMPGGGERGDVVAAWNDVRTYYEQASYGRTVVQVDVTNGWAVLDGTEADYLDGDNVAEDKTDPMVVQAAQAAVAEGWILNDYDMLVAVGSFTGFTRAWGNWSLQNFDYTNASATPSVNISLTADHAINLIVIGSRADWGRCAHEFGHNIVSAPNSNGDGTATLDEDVYDSDLVDPAAASAQDFEMMGNHDSHPLFSGYHLEKLGYYNADNIQTRNWDRNPRSEDFDIVAHGLSEDSTGGRCHLVKIRVAEGLFYYVQVRQRPGPTTQIFDESIPLGGAANMGGVIVTRVIADTLNINQQTRFITMLHDPEVLQEGEAVEDPARALRISVVDGDVQARPLVCRVRVEWAQGVVDDPAGAFDLSVEPWDSNWQTPDIWVDRAPFGSFDQSNDAQGRPQGNGDRPRPGELNKLKGRIHVSGAMGATNVQATFYAVFPPGVGDNGNWAPVGTQTIPAILPNDYVDIEENWVPVVGEHTCLKLYAGAQLGEVSGGNNFAQENVFDFEAPASSPAEPVLIDAAIRNPIDERRLVHVSVTGVPYGWYVHFPHAWVWLDGKAEKRFRLAVVPLLDWITYGDDVIRVRAEATAKVRLNGIIGRAYDTRLGPRNEPAGSRHYPIGGILGRVHVRKRVEIQIIEGEGYVPIETAVAAQSPKPASRTEIHVFGAISPGLDDQRVRVLCTDPDGKERIAEARTDEAGQFKAAFDLTAAPTLEADGGRWQPPQAVTPGIYRVVASTFAATGAADAESNLLYVERVASRSPRRGRRRA